MEQSGRWLGWWGNMPVGTGTGRLYLSGPFVVAELAGSQLTLHLRCKWFVRQAGVPTTRTFTAGPETVILPVAEPSRIRRGPLPLYGIGIQYGDERPWHFGFLGTRRGKRVLEVMVAALTTAGFTVEADARKM